MKVLVLGAGLQGKAVIHDLEQSPLVSEVVAADLDLNGIAEFTKALGLRKIRLVTADASNPQELHWLIEESGARIVVCMLPPTFGFSIARAALDSGVPFVSSSYTGQVAELDDEAKQKGITILPEMGMDPGIDLILAQLAIGELDEVHGLYSYGGGLPEPACANNPIKYKITWTFDGVLKSYKRPARLLRDGTKIDIGGNEIFNQQNIHRVDIPDFGSLEAYPNGDSIHYIDMFGLEKSIRDMGRFGLRHVGHCQFWQTLVDLGFLEDTPIAVNGATVSPHQFLVKHLTPRLQFKKDERDVVIVRISVWGLKNGKQTSVVYQLTDYRDLETGLFAMNRTVGYTTSIAAQLVLSGSVSKAGVLSPVRDVPAAKVLEELQARGMVVERQVTCA